MAKSKISFKLPSQVEAMRSMPSAVAKVSLYRSGAGVHSDNRKGYRRHAKHKENGGG